MTNTLALLIYRSLPIMQENNQQDTTMEGTVIEALPNAMFRIQFDGQEDLMIAYLSGKMRKNRIRVLIGDKVRVEIDPYGGKGRISRRL